MKTFFAFATLFCITATLGAIGCNSQSGRQDGTAQGNGDHDGHPTEGPNGGTLIELGLHEYHGELVHDEEAHKVTIYVYDAELAKPVAAEGDVTINAMVEGESQQFTLTAPPASDNAPQGATFELTDEKLSHALDTEDANAQLNLTIAGKQYVGKIEHAHEHEEGEEHHDKVDTE